MYLEMKPSHGHKVKQDEFSQAVGLKTSFKVFGSLAQQWTTPYCHFTQKHPKIKHFSDVIPFIALPCLTTIVTT